MKITMRSFEIKTKLMYHWRFKKRYHAIATEVGKYKADVLVANNKDILEFEVKNTLSDLKNDIKHKQKKHKLYTSIKITNTLVPNKFYFAVPNNLRQAALDEVEGTPYGVVVVSDEVLTLDSEPLAPMVTVVKKAKFLHKKYPKKLAHSLSLRMGSELVRSHVSDFRLFPVLYQESGIYKITNSKTGKVYIGSSCQVYGRLRNHFYDLRKGSHHSMHLQNSFNKYGEKSFNIDLLEIVDKDQILKYEQEWIDFYSSSDPQKGYNMSPTAGSTKGFNNYVKKGFRGRKGKRNGNYKHVNSTTIQKVVELYAKLHNVKYVSRKTGLGYNHIRRILKEQKQPIFSKGWNTEKRLNYDKQLIKQLYKQTNSTFELIKKYKDITGTPICLKEKDLKNWGLKPKINKRTGVHNGRYKHINMRLFKRIAERVSSKLALKIKYNRSQEPISDGIVRARLKELKLSLPNRPTKHRKLKGLK